MQEIVHQLGELFLQAVPTVLILLAFYGVLRAVFFKPLLKPALAKPPKPRRPPLRKKSSSTRKL